MSSREPDLLRSRPLLVAAGLLGASAVALGAYGAHGLGDALEGFGYSGEELSRRLDNFVTGSRYQLATAAAVLAIAVASGLSTLARRAGWLLVVGSIVFCGLLYALAFAGDGWRWLGAVVPLGGLAMIVGWLLLALCGAIAADRAERRPEEPSEATLRELVRLEESLSHQQRLLEDLNEAVTAIRDQSDSAARRQHAIELTVRRLVDFQQAAEDLPDEKPPHY